MLILVSNWLPTGKRDRLVMFELRRSGFHTSSVMGAEAAWETLPVAETASEPSGMVARKTRSMVLMEFRRFKQSVTAAGSLLFLSP
jgi:hypothetical protein